MRNGETFPDMKDCIKLVIWVECARWIELSMDMGVDFPDYIKVA